MKKEGDAMRQLATRRQKSLKDAFEMMSLKLVFVVNYSHN